MKSALMLIVVALFLTACQSPKKNPESVGPDKAVAGSQPLLLTETEDDYTIVADTANIMLSSYLTSIHADTNNHDLRSMILDADALRAYLNTDHGAIHKVKIMFAHTLKYIQEGHTGKYCGYDQEGLTFIIAGYDTDGNYVYLPNALVIDHAMPCPSSCPTVGNAQSNLLER